MGVEVVVGVAAGLLSAANSYITQSTTAANQAAQLEYQAAVYEHEAEIARVEGQVEQENLNREKIEIQEAFAYQQGQNISLLGSGNVDITSGSAASALEGNIQSFADDIGWNAYQKELSAWQYEDTAKSYEAQASYLQSTADSLGASVLTAGLTGLATGLSMYSMAGGSLSGTGTTGTGSVG